MEQQNGKSVKDTHQPGTALTECRVKLRQVGGRLDQFLAQEIGISRQEAKRLIEAGDIQINERMVREPRTRLRLGASVRWSQMKVPVDQSTMRMKLSDTALLPQVVQETDDFLVLNKPAGLSMHPVGKGKSAQVTLTHWISTHYPQIVGVGEGENRPGMIHRLDKDTSGIVLIAKHNTSFMALKSLFQERKIQKEYLALVYGNVIPPSGVIDKSLGRVKGSMRRAVASGKRAFGGALREAMTEYSLHTRYPQHDLLFVKPKTGRTHQIRVHLASLGHPVVGDKLYRFKEHRRDILTPPYQLLHAAELRFSLFGKKYHFQVPLPSYFQDTLSILALYKAETLGKDH